MVLSYLNTMLSRAAYSNALVIGGDMPEIKRVAGGSKN